MNKLFLSSALAFAMPVSAAQAQEFTFSYGGSIASEYVSKGIRYSDGPALQPYVEFSYGSAYAGAYTTNVDADLTGADFETGLSLGYRGEAGSFSYDISLNYYLYAEADDSEPVEDSAETILSGSYAATESFYLTAEVGIAPEYDQTALSLRVDYYTAVEGLSLDATYGRVESNYGNWNYWSAGATYQINDVLSAGLAYHDTDASPDLGLANADSLFVATLTADF
jgi:uncharacterized protein (TIGR02001 family)